jgi:D-sedoheptulose 7-phosphate isomerase
MDQIINNSLKSCKQALAVLEANQETLKQIASLCIWTLQNKGKIILIGNGGSAADAQHLAAEFVGRFKIDRQALPALALSTNTSILTAIGNDYGFDEVFVRQVSALANPQDIVIAISTSGNSKNIIKAVKKAKEKDIKTAGLLGKDGGELKKLVDLALVIASADTPRIQEMHILAGHIICEIIEKTLAQK